jgi:hypothetical protein
MKLIRAAGSLPVRDCRLERKPAEGYANGPRELRARTARAGKSPSSPGAGYGWHRAADALAGHRLERVALAPGKGYPWSTARSRCGRCSRSGSVTP